MSKRAKALAGIVVAVIALSALTAANASAAKFFHSEAEHTLYTASGTTKHVFSTPAMSTTCGRVTGTATSTTKTFTEITATPVYTECVAEAWGSKFNVTVNFNGCDYKFTSEEGTPIHIECPAGKSITISGPGCTVTVPAQTVNAASYENVVEKAPGHVLLDVKASGITSTASGFFCMTTGTSNTGTYSGSATVKGTNTAGTQVKIWWE